MAIAARTVADGRAPDAVLASLDRLEAALRANAERSAVMADRIAEVRSRREEGAGYAEIVRNEPRPLIVELLTASIHTLHAAGAQLRRAEALALHREGLTMEDIAGLFGVTRQRVSALLRDARVGAGADA